MEHRRIFPWQWDYASYPLGTKDEMYGVFYPEDIENIFQIDMMIREKDARERKRQEAEARRRKRGIRR